MFILFQVIINQLHATSNHTTSCLNKACLRRSNKQSAFFATTATDCHFGHSLYVLVLNLESNCIDHYVNKISNKTKKSKFNP